MGELARQFQARACVEILKPAIFIQRWLTALPKDAKHFAKNVDYYQPQQPLTGLA